MAVGVFGAAATILLHSLVVAVALWDEGAMTRLPDLPDAVGSGANAGKPDEESTERRISILLLSEVEAEPLRISSDAHLAEPVLAALKLRISGPDVMPLPPLVFDENGEPAETTDAELMARTRMIGIYESQIRARIERAWNLPTEFPPGQTITCRALIHQHRDGKIKEVELPYGQCEGSPELRQSLISAIFTASPLPAPPHPGVFVDSFSLVFRSEAVSSRRLSSQQVITVDQHSGLSK